MAQNSSGINTLYVCPVYWGCSVHWGDTISTLGGYHEYTGGYHKYIGGYMSTSGGYHEYIGGCSVHQDFQYKLKGF